MESQCKLVCKLICFLKSLTCIVRLRRKKRVQRGRRRPRRREWSISPPLCTRLLPLIQMNHSIVCVSKYVHVFSLVLCDSLMP